MLVLAVLIAASPVVAAPVQGPIGPICRNPKIVTADAPRDGATIHPLGDEPPAQHLYAVVRTLGGCNTPVVINRKVGVRKR